MIVEPGGLAVAHFNVSIGGVNFADGTASVAVIRNNMITTVPVNLSVIGIGHYVAAFTVPDNWVRFDQVFVLFTIAYLGELISRTKEAGTVVSADLFNIVGAVGGGALDASTQTKIDELYRLAGLQPGAPVSLPSGEGTISAPGIGIDVTGDCDNGFTLSRQ